MTFRWWAGNGLSLNAGLAALCFYGIRTSIAKKPYIFVIFQGEPDPLPPPLDPPMLTKVNVNDVNLYQRCIILVQ